MASHKRKARVIVKNFTEVDCQLNYNSTAGYQIPRASIQKRMVWWRTLRCADLFSSLRFFLMVILTFPDPSVVTHTRDLLTPYVCWVNFCLFVCLFGFFLYSFQFYSPKGTQPLSTGLTKWMKVLWLSVGSHVLLLYSLYITEKCFQRAKVIGKQ